MAGHETEPPKPYTYGEVLRIVSDLVSGDDPDSAGSHSWEGRIDELTLDETLAAEVGLAQRVSCQIYAESDIGTTLIVQSLEPSAETLQYGFFIAPFNSHSDSEAVVYAGPINASPESISLGISMVDVATAEPLEEDASQRLIATLDDYR